MRNKPKYKIGIMGVGMVGGALKRYFEAVKNFKRGKNLFLYDADPKKNYFDNLNNADIIFVSVPTPRSRNGSADLSILKNAISDIPKNKIIVIKSTIPPGTTEFFQKKYPSQKFLFNPEFLTEANAWNDMLNPNRQVVGWTKKSKNISKNILNLLPKSAILSPSKKFNATATEAEIIKYAANVFLTRKVTFANAIYDIAQNHKSNYENIKIGLAADERIGGSHLDVNYHGYRGYGGFCFTKDTDALISHCREHEIHGAAKLFLEDKKFNKSLLKSQGLTPEDVSVHDHEWIKKKLKIKKSL